MITPSYVSNTVDRRAEKSKTQTSSDAKSHAPLKLGDTCDFDMNLSQPFAAATLLILAIQLAPIGIAAVQQGVIAGPRITY